MPPLLGLLFSWRFLKTLFCIDEAQALANYRKTSGPHRKMWTFFFNLLAISPFAFPENSACPISILAEGLAMGDMFLFFRRSAIVSRLNRYTKEARQALSYAREEALRLRHRTVGTEHILLGIFRMNDPLIEGVFSSLHVSTLRIFQTLEFVAGHGNKVPVNEPSLGPAARAVVAQAEQEAVEAQAKLIGVD